MNSKKTIAFIPARGGSKRVPGKNIALINNKSLLSLTIEQAFSSNLFDDIIVSSDDEKILSEAKKYDVIIHERSSDLANDKSTLLQVIRHCSKELNWHPDSTFCLLQVTAPLREISDITNAHSMFISSDKQNAVVSVAENEHPVHLSWKTRKDGTLEALFPDDYQATTRKQDFYKTFFWNDAIIVDKVSNFFMEERNLFGKSPIPYIMPGERSINIDYPFQLQICQALSEKKEFK
jgi:CMP-N,N'-diacetyllegionaminic acid synthase